MKLEEMEKGVSQLRRGSRERSRYQDFPTTRPVQSVSSP